MPRGARLDSPGTLHHVIVRGIEKKPISDDDVDRNNFVERLGRLSQELETPVYAWVLMTNHTLLRSSELWGHSTPPYVNKNLHFLFGYNISRLRNVEF